MLKKGCCNLVILMMSLFFSWSSDAEDDPIFADAFMVDPQTSISGRLIGYNSDRPITVTLQSASGLSVLRSTEPGTDGRFVFDKLDPRAQYVIQVNQTGKRFESNNPVNSTIQLLHKRALQSGLDVSKIQENGPDEPGVFLVSAGSTIDIQGADLPKPSDGHFHFSWRADVSVSGAEQSSYINAPIDIEWLDINYADIDSAAAAALFEGYRIVLSDDVLRWAPEHAFRLLQSLERTGISAVGPYTPLDERDYAYQSVWELTADELKNDIDIDWTQEPPRVRISQSAFTYASPRIVTVDGKRGQFFSNRLFKAAVRFVTNEGQDISKASEIIRQRYGIDIARDQTFGGQYATIPIIEEDKFPSIWQPFAPHEVIEVMAMLEEFPPGMRDISLRDSEGGLRYLLRRRNGLVHPKYPLAPAVAWPIPGHDYAEFMDTAFAPLGIADTQRLIIHEKAHFIWKYVLSTELKYEWLKKSGWYGSNQSGGNCEQWLENADTWVPPNVDPETLDALPDDHHLFPVDEGVEPRLVPAWASCSTTQFVSAYAAMINPNEDMAESIAYFLTNPELLRSRALPKYEFIRDYIMQGTVYLSLIRPDLTFEVFNLFPDYVYPGKINRIDIDVFGTPTEDKSVTAEIGLHVSTDCLEEEGGYCFDGASGGFMRLVSPVGTYIDTYFGIEDGLTVDSKIRARFSIPSEAANGWWFPENIQIFDVVGNRRVEKRASNDFSWQLYVNNADPDYEKPEYVPQSLQVDLLQLGDPGVINDLSAGEQELSIRWRVVEERTLESCFSRIINYSTIGTAQQTYYDVYGKANPLPPGQQDNANYECHIAWRISKFTPEGNYGPGFISISDRARNGRDINFAFDHPIYEAPKTVFVSTPAPDAVAPMLDTSVCSSDNLEERCLRIIATPMRPDNPDGETRVRLYYWAWEDQPLEQASGVLISGITLRNPQGQSFHWWHGDGSTGLVGRSPRRADPFECTPYTLERGTPCDATTPEQYVFEVILPAGSAPGTWGLQSMSIYDYAQNQGQWQFTETLRFEVE